VGHPVKCGVKSAFMCLVHLTKYKRNNFSLSCGSICTEPLVLEEQTFIDNK
jgi:hypothetical protein